ncbi:MAG: nitroreductase/quinone reductase family protein [Chloroflexales bacterium]
MADKPAAPGQPTPPPAFVQSIMIGVLKSPLHGLLSKGLLLLRFSGRKSGKRYELPVAYVQDGNTILIASRARWWHNLRDGAQVELRLRGKDMAARADVAEDKAQLNTDLRRVLRGGNAGRFMQVELDASGEPNPQQLAAAIAVGWMVVRVTL